MVNINKIVMSVLNGHLWDQKSCLLRSFKEISLRNSTDMKFSMTGQESADLLYRWPFGQVSAVHIFKTMYQHICYSETSWQNGVVINTGDLYT